MISSFPNRRPTAAKGAATLYIFRSDTNAEIYAFAATAKGEALPGKYAPWSMTGTVLPTRSLPHGLNRQAAEKGVADAGFQLWRMKNPDKTGT
jgi:hypothetical protein